MPTTLDARALLFDMDGTLVDSGDAVVRVWTRFAKRFGVNPAQILASAHGVQMRETILRHVPEGTDVAAVERDLSDFERADIDGVVALPGAAALLSGLPQTSIALVTSASRVLAQVRMSAAGLGLPPVVVGAEDVQRGKPQPDCYLLAAERVGADPADCVVFEDAEAGIRAGLAAGMRVVVVGDVLTPFAEGCPRIDDYEGVDVAVDGDRLRVTFADT